MCDKAAFTAADIPDLSGQVIIVTGGNASVGKETVRVLLEHNATVYIAARSQEKAQLAISELKTATGKEAFFLKLDLSSLKSIKAAVEEFNSKETRLDALINNAGVMQPPIEQLTADGYDMSVGTNLLGPFLLATLLLPLLSATAKLHGKPSRVVNVSSELHQRGAGYDVIECARDTPTRRKAGPGGLYNVSKFGLVTYTNELARRVKDQGIVAISLHPGVIRTELQNTITGVQGTLIRAGVALLGSSVQQGALTQLYAATMPQAAELNGKYLVPNAKVGKAHAGTQKPEAGRALYAWLEEQVRNI